MKRNLPGVCSIGALSGQTLSLDSILPLKKSGGKSIMGETTITQKQYLIKKPRKIKLFSIISRGETVDDFMGLRKPEIKGM